MEVSPTQGAQSQPIQPDNSSAKDQHNLLIKTARQQRFLFNVLNTPISTHDLRNSVGSENIWGEARNLRQQGWLIITTHKTLTDRDGLKVSTGHYHLDESQCEQALEAIKTFNNKQEAA